MQIPNSARPSTEFDLITLTPERVRYHSHSSCQRTRRLRGVPVERWTQPEEFAGRAVKGSSAYADDPLERRRHRVVNEQVRFHLRACH